MVVHIDDHAKNSNDLPPFYVVGRVHEITPDKIVLDWWANPDPDAERNLGDEVECCVLVRGIVKKMVVLYRGDPFEKENE